MNDRLEPVVGLRDRRAVEGVGLDDVAARLEILVVDALDHFRLREHQEVVVALQVVPMLGESFSPEIGLRQAAPLNHRP